MGSLYSRAAGCHSGSRCKKFRTCEHCARIRQAQVADVAEAGAKKSPITTYAVIRCYDRFAVARHRAKFIKQMKDATLGGIWTIEDADFSGLHLNIIAGTNKPIESVDIARMWGYRGDADIWAQAVDYKDVRNVAAYICKRESIPAKDRFGGHTYGSYGQWKTPLGALVEARQQYPLAAAVALEVMLKEAGIGGDEYDDRGGIARVCEVAAGRLDTDGFCILDGWGILTPEDIKEWERTRRKPSPVRK